MDVNCMFFVKSTDGVKIAVYDPNPSGEKAVFLVHGWPLSHKIFEYQVELLLNYDYRVITIDLRGFGNSDAPKGSYSYNQMATDIYQVVKVLNLTEFILGGFSMGGAIVLRYMHNFHGFGVTKLLLMAAASPIWVRHPDFPYGQTRGMVDHLIQQARTDRPQLCYEFSHNMLFARPHGEPVKNWFEDISLSASGIATVQCAISLRDEDGRDDLYSVNVPTAIFQGEKDQVVPNDLTMIQYNTIPNALLYTLEDSGHGIMYDQLGLFNQYFLDFIIK